MDVSWSSISASAMAATMSLGQAAQGLTATAVTALPSTVHAGAATTAHLAQNLALVEKPVKAAAAGVQRSTALLKFAAGLSKVLPVVTITASTLNGARIVDKSGNDALLRTKEGRGAVLGAVGGALLLVPTPVTQVAAAGVLATLAANEFGAMRRFDADQSPTRAPAAR